MTEIVKRSEQAAVAGGIVAQYVKPLADVLPRTGVTPSAFMGYVQTQLDSNPVLASVAGQNALSFVQSCMKAALLGHVPDGIHGALVPYQGNNPKVEFIEMYRGVKARLERATPGILITAEALRENDLYEPATELGEAPRFVKGGLLQPRPKIPDWKQRGGLAGAIAYARFPNGTYSQVVELGIADIERYKPTRKSDFWGSKWEPEMWAKTALLRLEKFLPTSAENLAATGETRHALSVVAQRTGVALPPVDDHPEYDEEQPAALPAVPVRAGA